MLAVSILAIVAVSLGGLLGLRRPSELFLGPLRVFALISVSAIVLLQILPEAIATGGGWVLGAAVLAFAMPALWPRISRARKGAPRHGNRLTLELAYLSLIVHKVSDGLGLGVVLGHGHGISDHWELATALVAHTIPMAAIVAMSFRDRGPLHAAARLGGLAIAMIAGASLTELLSEGPLPAARPYFDAMAAGLLLHIVFHDLPRAAIRTTGIKLGELFAVGAGLAVALLGLHSHDEHSHAHAEGEVIESLVRLALDLGPALTLGLLLAALFQTLSGPLSLPWLHKRGALGSAARGAIVGAPLPVCSCGILPVASALDQRGVAPAATVAFLLATPELAPDTLLLTAQLLGWPWAIARLLTAVAVAIFGGWLIARLAARVPRKVPPRSAQRLARLAPAASTTSTASAASTASGASTRATAQLAPGPRPAIRRLVAPTVSPPLAHACGEAHLAAFEPDLRSRPRRFLRSLFDLIEHTGPWLLVGLLAAAFVDALVPAGALAALPAGLDVVLVTLLAVPAYVCASGATPLAAVLVLKGLSPGAALAGLLLGPATNLATLGFLRERFGRRVTWLGLGALVLVVWAVAFAMNLGADAATVALPDAVDPHAHEHDHAPLLGLISLGALGLLAAGSLWRSGLGTWLEALHGHHDHDHPLHHSHDALDELDAAAQGAATTSSRT